MGWRDSLGRLFGAAPKPPARKPMGKQPNLGVAGSPRAKLIAEALKIQKTQGNMVREVLSKAISELEQGGVKTLRDPKALTRLMTLIQTRRALQRMITGGMRELLGGPPAPPAPPTPPKSKVVRR